MKKCTLLIYSTLLFWACTKTNEPITNNSNTLEISNELSLNPYLPQAISVHKTQPNYIYVAAKNGGLIVLKETSSTLTQQAQLPINLFNNKEVMHLFQEGNYLYLALGNFFESGHKAGLAIVDISTPDNPTITDIIEADNTANGSAYIHVKDNYAYLCAMNNGLLIFDIQNKQQIQLLSQFVPDKNFPTPNPNSIQEPNARGFDIKDNYAYLCYDAGGIRVIDVSDKKNPQEISQYINGTFNKQKAYNNILINGNYAYVASDYCGLETLDISNPLQIKRVSWCNPWLCETPNNNWFNSPGHANQIAFDKQRELVYLSSGASQITTIDVSKPNNCVFKSSFGSRDNKLGVWGLTLANNKIYAAYINSIIPFQGNWSGVKCLTIKN